MSQFMVEFALEEFTEEFIRKVPLQRQKVNELMEEGKILAYSLASDRSKLWCVVKAKDEFEVMGIVSDFPLIDYMTPNISELMFNNIVALRIPLMSLN